LLKFDSSSKDPVEKRLDASVLVFENPFVFNAPISPTPIKLVISPLGVVKLFPKLTDEMCGARPEDKGFVLFELFTLLLLLLFVLLALLLLFELVLLVLLFRIADADAVFFFMLCSMKSRLFLDSIIGTSFNKFMIVVVRNERVR
jgi:hypothetical protein